MMEVPKINEKYFGDTFEKNVVIGYITRRIKQDFSENQRSNWSRLFCGMEILHSCAPVTFYCIWQGVYRTINRFINQ